MMKVLVHAKLSDAQLDSLRQVDPQLQLVREMEPEAARRELRDAEVLLSFELPGPLEDAPGLRWIQLLSAGAEHLLKIGLGETDVTITTVSGIHRTAIVEYTLWAMISLARRMPLVLHESERHQWRPRRLRSYYGEELCGKTLGILGLGAIGRQVATVARCLGMRVAGFRRSGAGAANDPSTDEMYGPEGLLEMLPRCDFVLVVLPLTSETRGLIGERELRAMKPSAGLINVARGQIVDEAALARALREEWIAGAAFDVFSEEPLPADSDLWDLPNLIVTPHMAGQTLPYMDRVTELFRENLRRYLAGEPLLNVLDKARGY